jgi:hypothetical protein
MRLIEKNSLFNAKRVAVWLIAASLVLTISAALASAFSPSQGQNKDGKPDFTGKWKAESLTKEAGEPPIPHGTITDPDGSTFKSKAAWNGKQLIITAQIGPGELKETWDLDGDRKMLIITKEFQDIRWKMVYKRQ